MSYNDIYNYYKTLRIMKKEGYDHFEQENMLPYERDLYIMFLIEEKEQGPLSNP